MLSAYSKRLVNIIALLIAILSSVICIVIWAPYCICRFGDSIMSMALDTEPNCNLQWSRLTNDHFIMLMATTYRCEKLFLLLHAKGFVTDPNFRLLIHVSASVKPEKNIMHCPAVVLWTYPWWKAVQQISLMGNTYAWKLLLKSKSWACGIISLSFFAWMRLLIQRFIRLNHLLNGTSRYEFIHKNNLLPETA